MKSRSKRNQAGYTLIDMAISMTIIGLLLSGIMAGARVYIRDKQMSETREHIQVVAKAIDNYVLETGHFPCPAAITLDSDNSKYGVEADCQNYKGYTSTGSVAGAAAANGPQVGGIWRETAQGSSPARYAVRGMVPFAALNLPDLYAYDGYGNKLQYVVTADQTNTQNFANTPPAITVVDSRGSSESGHANDMNNFLIFSTGTSQEGAWNRAGQQVRACGTGLDSLNCKDGKDAVYMSARYSTANGAAKFDDIVMGRSSVHMPSWQADNVDKNNIRTIDADKEVVIKDASSGVQDAAPTNLASTEKLRVDVVGAARANMTISKDYCLGGAGADATKCFQPSVLMSATGVGQYDCTNMSRSEDDSGFIVGIANNKANCRPLMKKLCDIGQYVDFIYSTKTGAVATRGVPECKDYNFSAGDPPALVVGSCGSANNKSMSAAPATAGEKCSQGTASAISGGSKPSDPWVWTCNGANGGTSASCKAYPSQPTLDGMCGPANSVPTNSKPTSGLCSRGTTSTVTGTGPWNWTCVGTPPATTASVNCNAPALSVVSGACGTSNNGNMTTAPTTNLCNAGTASGVVGTGPWTWSCYGSNGGTPAYCKANKTVPGVCGTANGTSRAFKPDGSDLCLTGNADTVNGTGPWTWSCAGENGGSTSNCSANIVIDGHCGPLSGQTLNSAPSGSQLCSSGTASTVNGSGPWTWVCKGNTAQGGTDANCSANSSGTCAGDTGTVAVNAVCGSSANTCSQGVAGAYNPGSCGGTATWACQGSGGGTNASCSKANAACAPLVNGSCGASNNTCSAGTASAYNAGSCGGSATWSCLGANGGTNASCSNANAACVTPVNGSCGGSNQTCNAGTPTGYNAGSCDGSATWTCQGANGGSNASCSKANAACVVPVNAVCGSSNNTCTAGLATGFSAGSCGGSATWTCQGSNGGSNASCTKANAPCAINGVCGASAATCSSGTLISDGGQTSCGTNRTWQCQGANGGSTSSCIVANAACPVNGTCGASNNTTVGSAPTTALCNTGSASSVSGSGPWTWTCSGSNGGSTASCSANKAASLKVWKPMGSYATYVGSMAKMDMDCGAVQPAACQGCTSFPAVTCTPGATCDETKTCLINQTTCHMSSGGNATQWDRYTCK